MSGKQAKSSSQFDWATVVTINPVTIELDSAPGVTIDDGIDNLTGSVAEGNRVRVHIVNGRAYIYANPSLARTETSLTHSALRTVQTIAERDALYNQMISDGARPSITPISILVKDHDRVYLTYGAGWELQGEPAGMIAPYAGASAPAGWLLCQGQAVSRTTYAALFAVTGTTYGTGDGSTTFNLPNLQGRVPVGLQSSDTDFNTRGKTGGAKTHTLTTAQIPAHKHDLNQTGRQSHTIAWGDAGANVHWNTIASSGPPPSNNLTTRQGTWVDTMNTGGGQAHPNLQPYLVVNYIIRS